MQGKEKNGNNSIFAIKILIIILFFKTCFERNFSGWHFGWESEVSFRFLPLHFFNH